MPSQPTGLRKPPAGATVKLSAKNPNASLKGRRRRKSGSGGRGGRHGGK